MRERFDLVVDCFRDAVAHLHDGLTDELAAALRETPYATRTPIGLAIGKAALAMARALGPVEDGLAVAPDDDGRALPSGWRLIISSHPDPDERSLVAGDAVLELVERAPADRVIVALISGGASALVEAPLIPLPELRDLARALMAAGAPIAELNAVRGALSAIKGGRLALHAAAPIVTLAISDVVGDRLDVIGSGPTIGPWLETPGEELDLEPTMRTAREEARRVVAARGAAMPAVLLGPVEAGPRVRRVDRARVVVPMARFAMAMRDQLVRRLGAERVRLEPAPLAGPVEVLAPRLAELEGTYVVLWGEPTVVVPAHHGEGGRMQQLALELAKRIRWSNRKAWCLASDGADGPPPARAPSPAGATVHGATWDEIATAGIDPEAARLRCDAGNALRLVDALIVTGPTGVNHADLVVLGY